ncbi:MAG TPA: ABC transporter ATP-binding protein [Bacilli bacterium]|nr:ABC transporter ATP-binding protein [Bacilli bacterium]
MKAIVMNEVIKKVTDGTDLGPLTIEIESGAITALVGANGIGKSTFLKMAMGFVKYDSGTLIVNGQTHEENEVAIKENVAYVGQRLFAVDHFTMNQLAEMNRTFYSNWQEERFQRYIEQLDIPLNKKIGKLSLGMQKRCSLALGLARDSKLLLLDEPSASLDIDMQRWLIEELIAYMEEDEERTIIIASHIVSEIKQLADYLVMFDDTSSLTMYEKDQLLEQMKQIWLQEPIEMDLPDVIVKNAGRLLITKDGEETLITLKQLGIEPAFVEALELEDVLTTLKHFESMNE